jgi:threonylcarbamoyladenosine tRNA methylthiotransferase MtaB
VSRTVAFATLGCRLNQVDTQQLQGALEAHGFTTIDAHARADVVVVNTCSVTARAVFSDRQAIRRAIRVSPRARVVVTGCWAQTDPGDAAAIAGVDLVVGNADKPRLPELLEALLVEAPASVARVAVGDIGRVHEIDAPLPARPRGRSRALVKIQDGCQHRCAFCIVPFARGVSRSLDPAAVVDRVRRLVGDGHPEVVLTGVDLGHYGADLSPRTTLAALLRTLVAIDGLRWLRLSSMLPAYFTEDLLEILTTSAAIAPHLHVPLQSGSDRVLRRMRRPYTAAMYARLVERLAAAIPALGIGADVIAGFPGESDADFEQTVALVRALPLSYLHVFPYSERRGTEAARLTGRVDRREVGRRCRALRELGDAKSLAFRRAMVGRLEEVLVLETRDRTTGALVGLTGNYVEVAFDGDDRLMRTMTKVRVTRADAGATSGERAEDTAG